MGAFRIYFIYALIIGTVFCSCQTVNVISIDYLVPAEISFPEQIRRVGIVNNVSDAPGRIKEDAAKNSPIAKSDGWMEIYTLNGNPDITTEILAESIATENYFDEVIICDSALQVSGKSKDIYLNKETVTELMESLGVDMLIALEQIRIKVNRRIIQLPNAGFLGNVDAKICPKVYLYVSNRNTPLMVINANDSIFWEDMQSTQMEVRENIPDELIVEEASEYAGIIPVEYMTPHWKIASRFLYNNGSPEMRDAAFFAHSNNWEKALPLWEKIVETKNGRKKMRAASNISLYYEIKDDLEKADEWGQKALDMAKVADKVQDDTEMAVDKITDYKRIQYNQTLLKERMNHFTQLKMQMDRFNNDF